MLILRVRENGATLPVTGATGITFLFRPPQGPVRSYAGQVHDGPKGQLRFTTTAADKFDQPGSWEVQVRFTLGLWTGHSSVERFTVLPNLPEQ